MEKFDVIKLKVDLPENNLKIGMIGVVVDIFDVPEIGYEVEFTDDKGRTIAEVALKPNQVEHIESS